MNSFLLKRCIAGIFAVTLTFAANAAAQASAVEKDGDGAGTTYLLLFIAIGGVVTSFLLWRRSKKGALNIEPTYNNRYKNYHSKAAAGNWRHFRSNRWKANSSPVSRQSPPCAGTDIC